MEENIWKEVQSNCAFYKILAYPIILTLSACGFNLYATKQVVQVPSTGGGVSKPSIFGEHQ